MFTEWFSTARLRVRALIHGRRLDRDLEQELDFHMATRAESSDPLTARRGFGNPTLVKETVRDMWKFAWIESILKDARYAARILRKSPAFAAVAILTLGFGIGATTAVFSVVDAVVIRPMPFADADRLVELWGNVKRGKIERRGTSILDFLDWKRQSTSFEGMALGMGASFTLTGVDEPERLPGEYVAYEYFSLLGGKPQAGRTWFAKEDEVPQRDAVVVLGDGLWKRRFGGNSSIIGNSIQLNGRAFTVIGVMGPGFRGSHDDADLWVPLMMGITKDDLEPGARGNRGPAVLAKLKPGVPLTRAQSEMDAICKRLEAAYPRTNEARGVEISPLEQEIFGDMHKPLIVLMAAVGVVLLIACTNVANLLLARSEARQREIAVRMALGAGRGRMLRQLATESFVMTGAGAALGLLLAHWGVRALIAASPVRFPGYIHPTVDWRVMLFTAAASCGAALAMGLVPAAHVRSSNLFEAFKQASSHAVDNRRGQRFRSALVVAEVAFAMVLLVGAGLLIRSLDQLAAIRPGFDSSHVLTLRASLPRLAPGATQDAAVTARQIVKRLEQLPSLQSVAIGSDLPFSGGAAIFYGAEGQPPVTAQNRPRAYVHRVTPSFFTALRIRFVAGRPFNEDEMKEGSNVVIVSENLVKRFWPGQDPIGKRIKPGSIAAQGAWLTIVGVINDMKYRGLPDNPTPDPDVFLPFSERQRAFAVVLRSALAPASLAPAVRGALRETDRSIVIYGVSTMDEFLAEQTAASRFTGWIMTIFAGSALLLAVIGIYGVMSYAVALRTQEIGVRVALGAARTDVLAMIVRRGMSLIAIGLAAGASGALALTRLIGTLLYGVDPQDAASFLAAALLMMIIALVACLVPASRAARIDPALALRN